MVFRETLSTFTSKSSGILRNTFDDLGPTFVILTPLQTILGYGIDNHLLGLRQMAELMGKPVPAIFEDQAYQTSNHFTLSTSQVIHVSFDRLPIRSTVNTLPACNLYVHVLICWLWTRSRSMLYHCQRFISCL